MSILWHGGEPLLMGKGFWRRALEKLSGDDNVSFQHLVQTNLLSLDEEWLSLLAQHCVRASTSVDPVQPELRVLRDGTPQFPSWYGRYRLAEQSGLDVGIVFTVSSRHIGRATDAYNFFRNLKLTSERGGGLQLNPMYPAPVSDTGIDSRRAPAESATAPAEAAGLAVSAEDYGRFLREFAELWLRDGRPFHVSPFSDWLAAGRRSCELGPACSGSFLAVDGSGRVANCGRFLDSGVTFGSILHEPLSEVLCSALRSRLQTRESHLLRTHCRDCPYWSYCHGGCPYHAHVYYGDAMRETPYCSSYRYVLEELL
jgi:uncharacterized protein